MKKRRDYSVKTNVRKSLNRTFDPQNQRKSLLQDYSWPSSRTIRVSADMVHLLESSRKVQKPQQLLDENSSSRSMTMTPRTLYVLDKTFRAPPVRSSTGPAPVHVDASSELSDIMTPEAWTPAFKSRFRARGPRKKDPKVFQSTLMTIDTSKSKRALSLATSLEESPADFKSPVLTQPLRRKRRMQKSKLADPVAFKKALEENSSATSVLSKSTSKHQDSASVEEEPESPQVRPRLRYRKRGSTAAEFEKVLDSRKSVSKLDLTGDISSEEKSVDEKITVKHFQNKRKKARNINLYAFRDILSDSEKSEQHFRTNSSKHQESGSVEEEPQSPQVRPQFHHKKKVAAATPEFGKVFETAVSTKSHLAADLSSRQEEEEEEEIGIDDIPSQYLQRYKKTRKIDASAFKSVLNESAASEQHSRKNSSKHQESGSVEEEPESPQARSHFRLKKKVVATAPEFEKVFETVVSTKSHITADLSSREEEEDEIDDVPLQRFLKNKKIRKIDASAFKSVLNKSETSERHSKRNSSKYQESGSVEEEPESPQAQSRFHLKKKNAAAAALDFEKVFETVVSTKSHLTADLSSREEEVDEIDDIPLQHFLKNEKIRKIDASAFKSVLNKSETSEQHSRRNSSKHQESSSVEVEPESPQAQSRFRVKKKVATTAPEFENALADVSIESHHIPYLTSLEEEEEEKQEEEGNCPAPVKHFQKKRPRQLNPSAFDDVFTDSGESSQHSEIVAAGSPSIKVAFQHKRKQTKAINVQKFQAAFDSSESLAKSPTREMHPHLSTQSRSMVRKNEVVKDITELKETSKYNISQNSEEMQSEIFIPQNRMTFKQKIKKPINAGVFDGAFSDNSDVVSGTTNSRQNSPTRFAALQPVLQKSDKTFFTFANDSAISTSTRIPPTNSKGKNGQPDNEEEQYTDTSISPISVTQSVSEKKASVQMSILPSGSTHSKQSSEVKHASMGKSVSTPPKKESSRQEKIPDLTVSPNRLTRSLTYKNKINEIDHSATSTHKNQTDDLNHSETLKSVPPSIRKESSLQERLKKTTISPSRLSNSSFHKEKMEKVSNTSTSKSISPSLGKKSSLQGKLEDASLSPSRLTRSSTHKSQTDDITHSETLKSVSPSLRKGSSLQERLEKTTVSPSRLTRSSFHKNQMEKVSNTPISKSISASLRTKSSLQEKLEGASLSPSRLTRSSTHKSQADDINHNATLKSVPPSIRKESSLQERLEKTIISPSGLSNSSFHKNQMEKVSNTPISKSISASLKTKSSLQEKLEDASLSPSRLTRSSTHKSQADDINHTATLKSVPPSIRKESSLQERLEKTIISPSGLSNSSFHKNQMEKVSNTSTSKSIPASLRTKSSLQEKLEDASLSPSRLTRSTTHKSQADDINHTAPSIRKESSLQERLEKTTVSPSRLTRSSVQKNQSNISKREMNTTEANSVPISETKDSSVQGKVSFVEKNKQADITEFDVVDKSLWSVKKQLTFPDATETKAQSASKTDSGTPSSFSSPVRQRRKMNSRPEVRAIHSDVFSAAFESNTVCSSKDKSATHSLQQLNKSSSQTQSRQNVEDLRSSQHSNKSGSIGKNSLQLQITKDVNSVSSLHSEISVQKSSGDKMYKQQTLESVFSKQREKLAPPGTQKRRQQLEAIAIEAKKNFKEELMAVKTTQIISAVPQVVQIPGNIIRKPAVHKRVNWLRLINGKPYSCRLKKPQPWATPKLYKLLIDKCGEKFGELKARKRAEEFMIYLCKQVSVVMRRKKVDNYKHVSEEVKEALYKLGIIKCLMDYFIFIERYLPFDYRTKVIECQRAYGVVTGIPIPPGTDMFADLNLRKLTNNQ